MNQSRRELALLLPALAAALTPAEAQKSATGGQPTLDAKIFQVDELPWKASASGVSKSKALFNGDTTRGQHITMHVTELAPGQAPHPAARQPHEEVMIIWKGTIECTIEGQTATLKPGDVVYSAYNNLKDWKNNGSEPAVYYVLSLEEHT